MLGPIISAAASLFGAKSAAEQARESQQEQMAMQEKFAQQGIQWKAADAQKAGISKLYALGANTTSYSPVSVGGGNGIAEAGQSIGRAIDATASPTGRVGHFQQELIQTQIEGAKLDNDIKRQSLLSTMALRNQPGNPPAYMNPNDTTHVMPGQGNSEAVALTPKLELKREIVPSDPNNPSRSIGVNPEVDMYRSASDGRVPMVPQVVGEALESQPLGAVQWMFRNQVLPHYLDSYRQYPRQNPDGSYNSFNPYTGEYHRTRQDYSWRGLMNRYRSR